MMEEQVVAPEQYSVEFNCGVENLSPYSSTASTYSDQNAYYQSEYEWQQQQQQQQQQQPQLQHQQQMLETERLHYQLYPAGTEVASQYSYSQHLSTAEYYQPNGLWPAAAVDGLSTQMTSSQRFFSGIDVSQQCHSPGSITGPGGKAKRKRVQSHTQRKAANVRERRRMFHLNEAFDELRKRLPAFNYEKRLSRIETLRLAMTYIAFMKEVSDGEDPKCVKLKPHGSELSGDFLPHTPCPAMPTGNITDRYINEQEVDQQHEPVSDDSDSDNEEHSNHSEHPSN